MIKFKRPLATILWPLTFCAVCINPSMPAGQPTVPPSGPVVQLPHQKDEPRKLESGDKIEDKMFPDGLSHDFGKVQQGAQLYHAFRIVNTSKVPLRITSIRVSMNRGTRAWSSKEVLQPNEEGKLEVTMDTRNYLHSVVQTIFLILDNGRLTEHRFWVHAESCDNMAFFPDNLDFGKIKRGDAPTRQMIVAVPGQPKLQVTGASCDSKFIQVKVQELGRGTTSAVYQVGATIGPDIPEGKLYTQVELSTNNPAMPKLLVPVSVEVVTVK